MEWFFTPWRKLSRAACREPLRPHQPGHLPRHYHTGSTGGRCHSSCFGRVFTLPDGLVDYVSVSGANAANNSPHSCILWNFPLVDRSEEDRRLVNILHNNLERRPVPELLQSQKAKVHVVIDCLCSHDKTSFSFEVQRLWRKETPFLITRVVVSTVTPAFFFFLFFSKYVLPTCT